MEQSQARRRQNHHCTLKNHERDLFIGQLTTEAIAQLGDTEAGTDKDEKSCRADTYIMT
jgi:hypothetical protein